MQKHYLIKKYTRGRIRTCAELKCSSGFKPAVFDLSTHSSFFTTHQNTILCTHNIPKHHISLCHGKKNL
jgi:hypothetical protein